MSTRGKLCIQSLLEAAIKDAWPGVDYCDYGSPVAVLPLRVPRFCLVLIHFQWTRERMFNVRVSWIYSFKLHSSRASRSSADPDTSVSLGVRVSVLCCKVSLSHRFIYGDFRTLFFVAAFYLLVNFTRLGRFIVFVLRQNVSNNEDRIAS